MATQCDGKNGKWSKSNEKEYVDMYADGATFDSKYYISRLTRAQRLRNYIKSAEKRQRDGTYVSGGAEVIEYAKQLLNKCTK